MRRRGGGGGAGDDHDLAVGRDVHVQVLLGNWLKPRAAGRGAYLALDAQSLGDECRAPRVELLELALGGDTDAPPQNDAQGDHQETE
jgi:hypothetical protein